MWHDGVTLYMTHKIRMTHHDMIFTYVWYLSFCDTASCSSSFEMTCMNTLWYCCVLSNTNTPDKRSLIPVRENGQLGDKKPKNEYAVFIFT